MGKYVDAERGLGWVRLQCSFPRNPKVLDLVGRKQYRALVAYIASLGYSGEHGLDGFVPAAALPFLHATERDAQQLERVGLWDWAEGGWDIHDWHDYQPSSEQVAKRRAAAKSNAEARWKRQRAADLTVVPHQK